MDENPGPPAAELGCMSPAQRCTRCCAATCAPDLSTTSPRSDRFEAPCWPDRGGFEAVICPRSHEGLLPRRFDGRSAAACRSTAQGRVRR